MIQTILTHSACLIVGAMVGILALALFVAGDQSGEAPGVEYRKYDWPQSPEKRQEAERQRRMKELQKELLKK